MEIWKDVKDYEGLYEVSNLGRVRSLKRFGTNGKIMSVSDNGMGYFRIKLTKNNKEKRTMLHRIIAIAFIPNPNCFKVINHKNGIKKDNSINNLEWCTQSENVNHAIRTGAKTYKSGCNHSGSKLTQENVLAVRRLSRILGNRINMSKVAKKLNVSQGAISKLIKYETYKNVA